ncbi:MAG: flavoprotein oxidoreductase, partial [Candidatus Marinimicrobia bacterium]|nr:flavoprotein oxidoreductase [Candidatus Neomarinimicrobiota bacterium]
RAGYYKPAGKLTVHVVANKLSGQLMGAQIVGGETAAKRIDPFAVALHNKMTLDEVAMLDLSYAPPYSPVIDPVGVAAQVAASKREKP